MRSDLSYSEQRSKTLMQINGQNPLQRVPTKLIHSACHPAGVTRGHSPSQTGVNALMLFDGLCPAMTPHVWLYLGGTSFSSRCLV